MTHDVAKQIHAGIEKTQHIDLKKQFLRAAVRYARIRTDWCLVTRDERLNQDQARRFAHNDLVDSSNILSRAMANSDEDTSWRRDLGDERMEIGDYACFLHCFLGLRAR